MNWDKTLELYDGLVDQCEKFDRKGKTVPYTSANGHMFSFINKAGELGMRFSKEVQEKYMEDFKTSYFTSHGATMKGYILIPEAMLDDTKTLIDLLNESYRYVMSLPPK